MWKLFRPDLQVTLLDSAKKRTDYLTALLKEINTECRVVTGRSEELAHDEAFRERYDVVTARAVANLASLCEYCLPFVKVGGTFLAMKGEKDELDSARKAIEVMGAAAVGTPFRYELPSGAKRSLIIIEKTSQTPTNYPRKRVNITKNPIA
jgi:16S rRNA (guanine527-N7)-methyltransferase